MYPAVFRNVNRAEHSSRTSTTWHPPLGIGLRQTIIRPLLRMHAAYHHGGQETKKLEITGPSHNAKVFEDYAVGCPENPKWLQRDLVLLIR